MSFTPPALEPPIEYYTVGWICAVQEEYEAACRMLDEEYDGPEISHIDENTYAFGCIQRHNIVVACLPDGRHGTNSAASVAKDMARSFPNLRFALMVGTGGGAPTKNNDIRLGDVVVSVPQGQLGGVVQYDHGKRLSDGTFQLTGQLNAPPPVLLGALPEMKRRHNDPRRPDRVAQHLRLLGDMPEYSRPSEDRLYRSDFQHFGPPGCENCGTEDMYVQRPVRISSRAVDVHYGIIASGNSIMENGIERDRYAQDPTLNVLCFETEAAGVMNNLPCLVIQGIYHYSDSHKNDEWRRYAALAAAAYARELLHIVRPTRPATIPSWNQTVSSFLGQMHTDVGTSKNAKTMVEYQPQKSQEVAHSRKPSSTFDRTSIEQTPGKSFETLKWLLKKEKKFDSGNIKRAM